MKVSIFDKNLEFDAHKMSGEDIFNEIMVEINTADMALSHMIVDGEELRNNHAKYIEDNLNDIKEIEVFPVTRAEIAVENALVVKDSLEKFIPILDVMAQDFRLGVSARGWKEFENMVNTLLYVDKVSKSIFNMFIDAGDPALTNIWDRARTEYMKLYDTMKAIEVALNADNPAEGGDLIQNKIKPVLINTIEYINQLK